MSVWPRRALIGLAVGALAGSAVLAGLIVFGTRTPPPVMTSISAPFAAVDFSDLPAREFLTARDGTALAYRTYAGGGDDVVLALHGSSTAGFSLHRLAGALSDAGATVLVPDIRGHGASGRPGDVDHIGQLEEDVTDFVTMIEERRPEARLVLLGFSSGGGLALRYTGRNDAAAVDRLVMIAPMLGIDAAPYTANNPQASDRDWSRAFVPRIIGLTILNRLGIHAFDHLPVIAFAVDPADESAVATYSHRLLASLNPTDHHALLAATAMPVTLLAGSQDEVFAADAYPGAIHATRPEATVTLVDGIGHVGMTLEPRALAAIVEAVTSGD